MFFDAAYCDEDAMTIEDPTDKVTVSSLLLLPYTMTFHGEKLGMGYVYGAGTLKKYRARGFMRRLMRMAVAESAERGDTFIGLIPASDSLRRYYGRFGFSTVCFTRPERYTSAHTFPFTGRYTETPINPIKLYSDFDRLSSNCPCGVRHSRTQFLTVMDDVRINRLPFAAVTDAESGRVTAMAWGKLETASNVVRVTELLAENPDAANAVLTIFRKHYPGSPVTLMAHPSDRVIGGGFEPGAMLRVVRPDRALAVIAATHPEIRSLTVRVRDEILPENSLIYELSVGSVKILPEAPRIDLDVDIAVLTSLMFSSAPIADITGLPATRPRLSLLLD